MKCESHDLTLQTLSKCHGDFFLPHAKSKLVRGLKIQSKKGKPEGLPFRTPKRTASILLLATLVALDKFSEFLIPLWHRRQVVKPIGIIGQVAII